MDDQFLIRSATVQDIHEMMRLARSSESAAQWSEGRYRSLIVGEGALVSSLALIAEVQGTIPISGFLVARHVALEWELENIVVALQMRGKGIGTCLIRELVDRAQRSNSEAVFLEVRESNVAARALYGKTGFHEISRRKSYYSNPLEDAILYCKALSTAVSR